MNNILDDGPESLLNQKIATLWAFSIEMCGGHKEEFWRMCYELYEMGLKNKNE